MVVLQRMIMLRVVAMSQANISPVTKSARSCRQNAPRLGGNANHTPERKEVMMIFGGPCKVRDSRRTQERYSQKAKRPPQIVVHITGSKPPRGYMSQPDDITFTHDNVSWVHHPHEDGLVITCEVANSLTYQLLVNSGSAVNILY